MSVMMPIAPAAETTETFGIADAFDALFRRSSQTSLNTDRVSKGVRRVIASWEDRTEGEATTSSRYVKQFPQDPVEAVDHIASHLGISQERVLSAVGVKPRTYYGWKTGHQARPQSLGDLWPMAEAIHYMAKAHPNLAAWFSSTSKAQDLFDGGKVHALIQLELDWALRSYPYAAPIAPDFGDSGSNPLGEQEARKPEPYQLGPRPKASVGTEDIAEVTLKRRNASKP